MRKISRRKLLSSLMCAPVGMISDSLGLEPHWLRVRQFQIGERQSSQRLVQFTDVHHKGDRAYLQKVVRRINELSPDLVCFTGDLVEENNHLPEALEVLSAIKAPLYGIPGNHDYWARADFKQIARVFEATGGAWLMDQRVRAVGGRLNLIGLSGTAAPRFALEPGCANVLLCHYPSWVENLGSARFDLILSGHSHGGQVRLPFIGGLVLPFNVGRYELGMYDTPAGPLYVNPGIGYFFLNIRFRCRPELTVFEI